MKPHMQKGDGQRHRQCMGVHRASGCGVRDCNKCAKALTLNSVPQDPPHDIVWTSTMFVKALHEP